MTEVAFFQDLAVVMSIAGLAAFVFSRLGLPKVFGYILVGVLLNEHTWGGSFLIDVTSVATISQLGIVFLMFSMGLEFSARDMKRMKGVTVPTALLDTLVMTWLGYTVGTRVFGWGTVASLFLGVAICDSATTLLAKVVGEMGWSGRKFVKDAMGTSVCEDVVCVGLIALVTGVANGEGMSLAAVGRSLGGLLAFFLATVVFGLMIVPAPLRGILSRRDDETMLMFILGICFFVSWAAYKLEFSLALGAFLVGIIGSTSEAKERLHAMVSPLKTMFAAMFFMSIGLLVDPVACGRNALPILVLTVTVVLGKGLNCFVGGLLAGLPVKNAVQMAMSLAQVGEFAFMVAILYVGLTGNASTPMFQATIGASLATSFLNPFMIRWSEPVGTWAERKCPKRIANALATYRAFLAKYRAGGESAARRKVRAALVELGIIGVLEFAVSAAFTMLARHDWSAFSTWFDRYDTFVFFVLMNVFILLAFAFSTLVARSLAEALCIELVGGGRAKWQQVSRQFVRLFVYLAVLLGAFAEGAMINLAMVPDDWRFEWGVFAVMLAGAVVGWRFLIRASLRAREQFDEALKTDARLADLGKMISFSVPESNIRGIRLGPRSPAIGGTVVTLNIRAMTGASVIAVERDGVKTRNIGPEWTFSEGDVIVALGEPAQIAALKRLVGVNVR